MKSIYHILDKRPDVAKSDMQEEYENLANKLVKSGKLRIDTGYYRNFVHYNSPSNYINVVFSELELTRPDLINESKLLLKNLYKAKRGYISEPELNSLITNLQNESKKLLSVSENFAIKLARIFVQSAHPIVIKWLLRDKVEVFITYSHSIGDVMNIQDWKHSGTNSGMQSTDGKNVCIYVSCGGDPFAENHKESPTYGDGWAALARLQIIAAQEIGHYADIKRDYKGNQITRHSADFACTKATPHVKKSRQNDVKRCKDLLNDLLNSGIRELINLEKQLIFYEKQNLTGIKTLWIKLKIKFHRAKLFKFAEDKKLYFIKRFKREKHLGISLVAMVEDMQSHLSPSADVYKRKDKEAQEAISCVEALARVPQQVMKWGYLTTRCTMHDLYKVYYNQVIPSLIENYNHLEGVNYRRNYKKPKRELLQRIFSRLGLFEKEDKVNFIEVRDLE